MNTEYTSPLHSRWDASMVICLEWGAYDLHIVQLIPLPPHHLLPH